MARSTTWYSSQPRCRRCQLMDSMRRAGSVLSVPMRGRGRRGEFTGRRCGQRGVGTAMQGGKRGARGRAHVWGAGHVLGSPAAGREGRRLPPYRTPGRCANTAQEWQVSNFLQLDPIDTHRIHRILCAAPSEICLLPHRAVSRPDPFPSSTLSTLFLCIPGSSTTSTSTVTTTPLLPT